MFFINLETFVWKKDIETLYQMRGGAGYIPNHDQRMDLFTTTNMNSTKDFCTMDSFGRSISLFGAGIVLIQSLIALLPFDNQEILQEVCLFIR